jgi:hypothetical protein
MATPIHRKMVRIPGRVIERKSLCVQKVKLRPYYLSAHKVTVGEFSKYIEDEPRMKGQVGMDAQGRLGVLRRGEGNDVSRFVECLHDPCNFDRTSAETSFLHEPVDLAPTADFRHLYKKHYHDASWPMTGVNLFHILGYIDWETRQARINARHGVLRLPYAEETSNAALGKDGTNEYGTSRGVLRGEAGQPLAHFNPRVASLGHYVIPVGSYPGVLWPDGEIFDLAGNGFEFQNGLFLGAEELYAGEGIIEHPIGAKSTPGGYIGLMPRELRGGMFQRDENDRTLRADYGVPAMPFHANLYTGFRLAADAWSPHELLPAW